MDWKVVATTFTAVFFAELADKTQLVGIVMAGRTAKPLAVFFGSVFAYMVITAVSVWIGSLAGQFLKPEYIRIGGAVLFIGIGVFMLLGK
ncbi:MAG: TMEM165/GDT1 family protein [Candidatus Omnitrophica bacterium]|nr:TMEM165/GDT1 family protein [Candidatus Omnitrophota bacterium]